MGNRISKAIATPSTLTSGQGVSTSNTLSDSKCMPIPVILNNFPNIPVSVTSYPAPYAPAPVAPIPVTMVSPSNESRNPAEDQNSYKKPIIYNFSHCSVTMC